MRGEPGQSRPPPPVTIETRFRYNQDFKSVYAIVPGTIMMLLVWIPSMMTAAGVVREKEMGSITNLYATPVSGLEFLLGKQAPYVLIALLNFSSLVLLAVFLFQVPVKGSFAALLAGGLLYIIATTGLGLLISSFMKTQIAAIFGTAIITTMPAVNFSGFFAPVASLTPGAQVFSQIFPSGYFQQISLGTFTKALGFEALMFNLGMLALLILVHLIAALIEKRLPSYSLLDSQLVERGLLMAEAPATDWRRLARRNALNMHAVIHGEPAERQPVRFKSKRRLTINMATARALGISPRFDILHEALLFHEEPEPQGRSLSLAAVALEAVAANLDLQAAALGLEAGQTNVDQARAKLLPQLNASIGYTRLNDNSTAVISGAAAEQSTTAAIRLSQLIYSDSIRANVEIQRYLQNNRQALKRQLELDIILEASTAYLNLLKAQTLVQIRREDMNLSRTNLELARDRQLIGVASPAEVYRWESELATSRQELLDAQAQLQQARDAINRLLHRPLKESFIAEPATLDDPSLMISRKELFEYVSSDRTFELMGDFMLQEGVAASPELESLEALIAASKRQLESHRRAYWSPTVTLQGEIMNVMDETRSAGLAAEGDTDWSVGVQVSLPLFEGGARSARRSGSQLAFNQHLIQRDATRERIKQRIRVTLHRIGASYPSIQLSKDAANAARKNLDLVTDAYSRGAISILDLLDAQNAALVAEESATNAVFDFLIDLMNLQRSLGRFDFFLDEQGLDSWLERLQRYIISAQ